MKVSPYIAHDQEVRGLSHDYEVVAFCVDAYLRYIRSLAAAMDDIAEEIAQAERG